MLCKRCLVAVFAAFMNIKPLFASFLALTVIFRAEGQLAITEVMSGETDKNHPDWYELHNYGTNSIDLSGYSWNDDAHSGFAGADSAPFTGITVAAGETILVTEQKGAVTSAATFSSWWGVSGFQVVVLNAADPGLSASPLVSGAKRCDSVRIWNTNLAALGANTNGLDLDECSDYLVHRADLGVTVSQSVLFDPVTGVYDLLSSNGVDGAFGAATVSSDVGSPGIAPAVIPPVVTQTPVSKTVTVGDSVTFTNGGIALPPLLFKWYFNSAPITSQTPGVAIHHLTPGIANDLTNDVSVLGLTLVQLTNAGTYSVVASTGLQSFTNTFTLTVNQSPVAPSILSSTPALDSFDGCIGQTVNFSVLVSGYPAPTYQWYKDNSLINGATGAQFPLALTDTNQSGNYSVTVTNSVGGTNLSFALRVTPLPNLVITEVMSGESTNNANGSTTGHNDWFELSNLGNFAVNLHGYRVDDSHNVLSASATITNKTLIQPGESVVFVQDMTPAQFRAWWGTNLGATVQIVDYNGSGQGLSGSGDDVHVWNAVATVNSDQIAGVSFLAGTDGVSFGFDPTRTDETGFLGFAPDGQSVLGVNGAFAAAVGGDIGSPGTLVNVPRFTVMAQTSGGFQVSWVNQPDWNYLVEFKNNLSDVTWTTLTNVTSDASSVFSVVDPAATAQRFYRVSLVP